MTDDDSQPPRKPRGRPPKFQPTDDQKRFVALMSAGKLTFDEMRSVILNPKTNKPITRDTLAKCFAPEISSGKTALKLLALSKAHEALERSEEWAIRWALKYGGFIEEGGAAIKTTLPYGPPIPVFIESPTRREAEVIPSDLRLDPMRLIEHAPAGPPPHMTSSTMVPPATLSATSSAKPERPKTNDWHNNFGAGPDRPAFRSPPKKGGWMS